MRVYLYQGTSEQFIADAVQARLANQLAERFFQESRYKPGMSEVHAWQNSLGAMRTELHPSPRGACRDASACIFERAS
jgi:hypothetical protein